MDNEFTQVRSKAEVVGADEPEYAPLLIPHEGKVFGRPKSYLQNVRPVILIPVSGFRLHQLLDYRNVFFCGFPNHRSLP